MAKFVSVVQFDITQVDLNFYSRTLVESEFIKNANLLVNDTRYPDYLAVEGAGGATLQFFGSNFAVDSQGVVTGGNVGAVVEGIDGKAAWYAQGNVLAAAETIYAAALTASNSDDIAVIANALRFDDTITLSAFDDRMNGYGGSDWFTGGGGNDILDGGEGSDTAFYASALENCVVTFDGSVCVITAPGEGTDRLTGFEFINFADQNRSIASLADLVRPTVVEFSPPNGTSGQSRTGAIFLTFSEAIRRGTGNIYLRQDSETGPIVVQYNAATSGLLSFSGNTLALFRGGDLDRGIQYFVTFDPASVKDTAGNNLIVPTGYNFTTAANRAPTFTSAPVSITSAEDTATKFTVTATDADADSLNWSASAPANGTVISAANGVYTYTPNKNFNGSDSFQVTVSDNKGGASSQTVTVTVTPVGDAPSFITPAPAITTTVGTAKSFTAIAVDPDGQPVTYSVGVAANGSTSAGGDGNFAYIPNKGFIGADSFSISATDGKGTPAQQTVTVTVTPPASSDWRLFASNGFGADMGGSGQIFGTAGFQDVTVINAPGSISFDPSFNRGGDVIRLAGAAGLWKVIRSGSSAIFSDGDTFVQLPVGDVGTAIVFADGARSLKFDGSAFRIGGQQLGSTLQTVTAAADGTAVPTGEIPTTQARLFLSAGSTVSADGNFTVFGTSSAEKVSLTAGSANFDPSFNGGGDRITIAAPAAAFAANQTGSSILLDSADLDLRIPIGTKATTLVFAGGDERELVYDLALTSIRVGEQLIGLSPVPLAPFA